MSCNRSVTFFCRKACVFHHYWLLHKPQCLRTLTMTRVQLCLSQICQTTFGFPWDLRFAEIEAKNQQSYHNKVKCHFSHCNILQQYLKSTSWFFIKISTFWLLLLIPTPPWINIVVTFALEKYTTLMQIKQFDFLQLAKT